ncbi:MAG: hypothetical protein O7C68_04200 [Rickettsia endosymbiont of Ixodes ricinus]|uniref:Site-2 protease family protein n=1 Tax=Rickettsia helvetica TaxID=35789 RepID=A0ABP0T628_RICHE|nr:hypothetical protein [Rickettsia helvetica]MCZ6884067.1 hypothetical protein [Rickettsia endosymbiont of Ixodes ricinus]MCZ6896786.1 hypothetical protein [Rickettsia endosymbiont of Ixodes ricinus]
MLINTVTFVATLIIFVYSIVIHEVSHGICAHYLGDPTAKNMGRLSLNPIKHLSILGIVLPII